MILQYGVSLSLGSIYVKPNYILNQKRIAIKTTTQKKREKYYSMPCTTRAVNSLALLNFHSLINSNFKINRTCKKGCDFHIS